MNTASHNHSSMSPDTDNSVKMKEHDALMDLVPKSQATHTATKSGSWFDPNVWQGGNIPGDGAHVMIPEGINLRYTQESDARLKTVRLDGTLTFASNQNTKMVVDTFVETGTGVLNIGTEEAPIQANRTAQIVFADEGKIDRGWDPTLVSRGLVTHGKVRIHGAEKTDFSRMRDVQAGDRELVLMGSPQGWQVGDKLVVGGTDYNKSGSHSNNSRFQDEVLTITSIDGNRIRFTNDDITSGDNTVLRFDHVRPDIPEASQLNLYVANTTRNVIFETENASSVPTQQRGHVMFMHNPDVVVQNAGFYNLGRTDKTKLVDDIGRNMDGSSGAGTNRRARYPLHFHRNGSDDIDGPPAIARGNAVVNGPGWGIVHHDSHAVLEDNVVFNVAGAGIVAESGNELGAWRNNLTIKTTGTGKQVLNPEVNRREGKFDLGFEGEGYWVQGAGQVAMEDNIAVSANKSGITIFGDTLRATDPRDVGSIRVENLPSHLQKLFPEGTTEVDITDVPLHKFSGFESYNSNTGISIWAHLTNFDGQLSLDVRNPNATHEGRSTIENFKVWNNRSTGVRADYSSSIDYVNGIIVGDASKPVVGTGVFQNEGSRKNTYKNLTVRGFVEGANMTFPGYGLEKSFTAPSIEDSRFGNNTYNLTRIGNDPKVAGRPDDFSGLLKIQNTVFEDANARGNASPVAAFSEQLVGGLSLTFDGGDSADSDPRKPEGKQPIYALESKGIASYAWDFDQDGEFDAYGRYVTHHFNKAGNHKVTLRVLDNQGAADTITKTVEVTRTEYTNPFVNGDFQQSSLKQSRLAESINAGQGWLATQGVRVGNDAVVLSNKQDKSSAIAQVIHNEQLHKGQQTLSFSLKNQEGSNNPRNRNDVIVQLWGINGQFGNNIEVSRGPIQSGTLPIDSTRLAYKRFSGDSFDWKDFNESVNLGDGYEYLAFQVNTEDTGDGGDIVAVDNVSLTSTTPPDNSEGAPSPTSPSATSIRFEAEDMRLSGEYRVEAVDAASGGKVASLQGGKPIGRGRATFDFRQPTGTYDIKLTYFDENDGNAHIRLFHKNVVIDSFNLTQQLGSSEAVQETLTQRTIENVSVRFGDRFSILGIEGGTATAGGEPVRLDAIEFIPRDDQSSMTGTANYSAATNSHLGMSDKSMSDQAGDALIGKHTVFMDKSKADVVLGAEQLVYTDGPQMPVLTDYTLTEGSQHTPEAILQMGNSEYQLGAAPMEMHNGASIFAGSETDDLSAMLKGNVGDLQLGSSASVM